MEDDVSNLFRRVSMRTRKIAPKWNFFFKAAIARLEALENDYTGMETVEAVEDDEASLEDDVYIQKKQKDTKRKTLQVKALENARKAPRNFLESKLKHANLKALFPHIPSYMRVVVGPPSSTCRVHFCIVCEFISNYTCAKYGMFFFSI
ncbi:SWR1 complex [Salix suchowensis]|nr:SWR1 complex [Salix suchowensis]